MKTTGMISALALSLALGMVTTAEAEDWTGAHLTFGVAAAATHLNSGNGESEVSNSDVSDQSVFMAVGYDWAMSGLTVGLVADIDATSGSEDLLSEGKGQLTESDWFATLRGRVGMPVDDRMQVYASGGLALMGVSSQTLGALPAADKARLRGGVVGLGLERQLAPGRNISVEYLHADFGQTLLEDTGVLLEPVVDQLRIGYRIRF